MTTMDDRHEGQLGDCSTCEKWRPATVGHCVGCSRSFDSGGRVVRSGWVPRQNINITTMDELEVK